MSRVAFQVYCTTKNEKYLFTLFFINFLLTIQLSRVTWSWQAQGCSSPPRATSRSGTSAEPAGPIRRPGSPGPCWTGLAGSFPICSRYNYQNFYPILQSCFRDSCFTCDGFSNKKVFPLLFNIGMVIQPSSLPNGRRLCCHTEGGGQLVVGGGGSPMTHCAGSVTTQSIAFKYVMASEPYRYT